MRCRPRTGTAAGCPTTSSAPRPPCRAPWRSTRRSPLPDALPGPRRRRRAPRRLPGPQAAAGRGGRSAGSLRTVRAPTTCASRRSWARAARPSSVTRWTRSRLQGLWWVASHEAFHLVPVRVPAGRADPALDRRGHRRRGHAQRPLRPQADRRVLRAGGHLGLPPVVALPHLDRRLPDGPLLRRVRLLGRGRGVPLHRTRVRRRRRCSRRSRRRGARGARSAAAPPCSTRCCASGSARRSTSSWSACS